jgi:hypothetical protein
LPQDVKYPPHERYTLQWLQTPEDLEDSEVILPLFPNNNDATFKKFNRKPKPSDLILHYNYGAAAVKWWGHGVELLKKLAIPPRPSVPVPTPSGPSKVTHNREAVIKKLTGTGKADGAGAGNAMAGAGTGEMVELEGQAWDEDDIMLFFWGNSRAAKERHQKKVDETTQQMELWREGVAQDSV